MVTKHRSELLASFAWCVLVFLLPTASMLQAQDPVGPFGEPAAPEIPAAAREPSSQPVPEPKREPLVVKLIRESNPATPYELTRAVQLMVQTSELEEAKRYLGLLVGLKMSPVEQANLQRDFGSGFFLNLSLIPELQPAGAQISQRVADAAFRRSQDPLRIADLIARLNNPDASIRLTAMEDLKPSGTAAVIALANIFSDPERAQEFPVIRSALMELAAIAPEPLIGYLQSPNVQQQVEIIHLLGYMKSSRATMYLARMAVAGKTDSLVRNSARLALLRSTGASPSRQEAENYLQKQLQDFHQGLVPVPANDDNTITLWQWDREKKSSVAIHYPRPIASVVLAAQTATELYAIDQSNPEYRRLYFTHILAASKQLGGIDQPLTRVPGSAADLATKAGKQVIHDVFQHALASNHIAAAVASAEVLGSAGSPDLLKADNGNMAPLVQALLHSNRRLRFAAMQAILQLDPKQSYPGASHLAETLGYFISTSGERVALVGHPLTERAQFLTGLLNQAGYRAGKSYTGRSLLQQARQEPDCDLVLINNTISNPGVAEIIQQFRNDPRTATIPIGIMADPNQLESVRMLTTMDRHTVVIGRPHNLENMAFFLAKLEQQSAGERVGITARINQARQALDGFFKLTQQEDYRFYDLPKQESAVIHAVTVGALSRKASPILGALGTARSQEALVNTASRNNMNLAIRQAAQRAFDQAVQDHRLLLSRKAILLQYDRYNASANLDKQTQTVLGSILDSIERRARTERSLENDKEGN